MNLNYINVKEEIIEFLIINYDYIRKEVDEFKKCEELLKSTEMSIFHQDIEDQCEARIKQWIAFYTADRLALPVEYIIIELEKIDLKDFLDAKNTQEQQQD